MTALRTTVVADAAALAEVGRDWNRLLAASRANSLFLTWEWIATWWQIYGAGSRLNVLTAHTDDGRLVGIAPLKRITRGIGGVLNVDVVEFIGHGGDVTPEYLDFIVDPEHEGPVLTAFADLLLAAPAAVLDLRPFAAHSANLPALVKRLEKEPGGMQCVPDSICPQMPLPSSLEAFMADRSRNYRKKVKESQRRIARDFGARVRVSTTQSELQADLDALGALHQRRWDRASRAFRSPEYREFHRRFAALMLERDATRLFLLENGREPLAALYCFVYGGRYYYYQSGRNPDHPKHHLGLVLLHNAIQEAIKEHADVFDFLRGQEEYKFHWAKSCARNVRVVYWPTPAIRAISRANELWSRFGAMMSPDVLTAIPPAAFSGPRRRPVLRQAAIQSAAAAGRAVATAPPDGRKPAGAGRRLRVLEVIGTMHIGGAENVVVELCRGLDRSRFDLALCCTRETGVLSDRLQDESIDVILGAPPTRRLRHFTPFYLDRVIARFQPDIVHTHGTPSLLHAGPLAVLHRLPSWVHTFHFGNYAAAKGRMMTAERWFCRAATQLVAVSEAQRRQIVDFHGLSPDRIMTIVNGVSGNARPGDDDARRSRRAQCGFGPDDIVVGCVAVLSEQKGVTYLIQAAREFLNYDGRLRLLVVGGGPLQPSLRAEAERLDLGPRAVFTGWQPDGVEWLKALDVFVMSSLWEAMPMALLEAMAAQKALIVTDVADNRAILEDGRCGIVVPPRDAAAIAAGVRRIVRDREGARAMAQRAHERFLARYTTARMVRDYERLFELLATPRSATGSTAHVAAS